MKIVILTGSELRHNFARIAISALNEVTVLRTYCEGLENSLKAFVVNDEQGAALQQSHINARTQSEEDFFRGYVSMSQDKSNPKSIRKGRINDSDIVEEIEGLAPDLVIAYGCSLIKPPLIEHFKGRFLNVHLGLSPYYRGGGTNFWPLVNGEPQFVGATFMYIDPGVDTGAIIHQLRAEVRPGDTPHQIGNRLIVNVIECYRKLIQSFPALPEPKGTHNSEIEPKYYRRKDFSPDAVEQLYRNFLGGLVSNYLADSEELVSKVPILKNPLFEVGS
jgi:phosphoribosylglycinamide formyltransferase 1